MRFFVDTSVWSLAFRRDNSPDLPHVALLRDALTTRQSVYTTGLILQELLQGVRGPKAREELLRRFAVLPSLVPDHRDHVEAASLFTLCRGKGAQIGTVDALIAQLSIRHHLPLLTTDRDFENLAKIHPLDLAVPA